MAIVQLNSAEELLRYATMNQYIRERRWKLILPYNEKDPCRLMANDRQVLLGTEFGNRVKAVWTMRPSRYSRSDVPAGTLTLSGLLNRLGEKDAAKTIKNASAAYRAEGDKNHRNTIRREINKRLAELEALVNRSGKDIGVTVDMFQLPIELADKLKEES